MAEAPESRHDFERRLNDEIGCAEGCACLSPAIRLAEEMCDSIAKMQLALRRIADCEDYNSHKHRAIARQAIQNDNAN